MDAVFHCPGVELTNFAWGGGGIFMMGFEYDRKIRPLLTNQFPVQRWFILQGGHGDLFGAYHDANRMLADSIAVLKKAKEDGFKTMLCTMPSCPYESGVIPGKAEAERQKFNTEIRTGKYADKLFDLDLLIPPGQEFRQADGFHLSDSAEVLISKEMTLQFCPDSTNQMK